MIEHFDDVAGTIAPADVCIVGGGAAGITLALSLARHDVSVVLLEGGGESFDQRSASLYQGENVGLPLRFGNAEFSLDSVRLRYLGGSTNHWTGMCHPLDAGDFAARPHLPWSGWPFGAEDMAAYYDRAQETCELGGRGWDAVEWFDETYGVAPRGDTEGVRPVVYRFGPPTRFGERYRAELHDDPRIRVYLGANVVDIAEVDGVVRSVQVRSFAGRDDTVQAGEFVLATGGLEVPRLLLASTGSSPVGIGNEHDLVGRTFMEHPHFVCGRLVLTGSPEELAPYRIDHWGDGRQWRTWTGFALDAGTQERAGIGNAAVFGWADGGAQAVATSRIVDDVPVATGAFTGRPAGTYTAFVRTESRPDPESRVTLGDDVDPLGMRRLRLDWRIGDFEWDTARTTLELLATALGATGTGRLEVDPGGSDLRSVGVLGMGNHHMGTARMSTDPAAGVVDEHCRVHTTENLHIAGSAVFPTAGAANPTLTIVALAHRLADHLAGGT